MKDDSGTIHDTAETHMQNEGSCAGGMPRASGVSRRLRSLKDRRVKVVIPAAKPRKPFDKTAWYVAEVKRSTEIKARQQLNHSADIPFEVEAYAATQVLLRKEPWQEGETDILKEKVVIRGKIFIRVAQEHRIDVLKACPYLTRYLKDPALSRTEHNFTDFARVPDKEIRQLTEILNIAGSPVKYSNVAPEIHDRIQIVDGQLSKLKAMEGLRGEITMVNGRKYATVILDTLGCFKFRLPLKDLAKLSGS